MVGVGDRWAARLSVEREFFPGCTAVGALAFHVFALGIAVVVLLSMEVIGSRGSRSALRTSSVGNKLFHVGSHLVEWTEGTPKLLKLPDGIWAITQELTKDTIPLDSGSSVSPLH